MHESLRLLDKAAGLVRQEIEALDMEKEEELQELCEQRVSLVNQAWEQREGCDQKLLVEALIALQNLQRGLTVQARSRSRDLSDALLDSRQESTRVSGYRKVTSQNSQSLYISRVG